MLSTIFVIMNMFWAQSPITFRTWSHGVRDYLLYASLKYMCCFDLRNWSWLLTSMKPHVYYHFYATCLMNIIEAVFQNNHILCQVCIVKYVILTQNMWCFGQVSCDIPIANMVCERKHLVLVYILWMKNNMNLLQMDLIIWLFLGGVAMFSWLL
jgi:hypothetical protein